MCNTLRHDQAVEYGDDEEETEEVRVVPLADAVANPWAVVLRKPRHACGHRVRRGAGQRRCTCTLQRLTSNARTQLSHTGQCSARGGPNSSQIAQCLMVTREPAAKMCCRGTAGAARETGAYGTSHTLPHKSLAPSATRMHSCLPVCRVGAAWTGSPACGA